MQLTSADDNIVVGLNFLVIAPAPLGWYNSGEVARIAGDSGARPTHRSSRDEGATDLCCARSGQKGFREARDDRLADQLIYRC